MISSNRSEFKDHYRKVTNAPAIPYDITQYIDSPIQYRNAAPMKMHCLTDFKVSKEIKANVSRHILPFNHL